MLKLVFQLVLRLALLVGCGWALDRWLHIGWLVGICLLSVFDREAAWIVESSRK